MGTPAVRPNIRREGYTAPAEPGETPVRISTAVTRKYLVVGPHAVEGAVKGEVVDLTLTDAAAAALIEAGHVVLAPEVNRPSGRDKRADPSEPTPTDKKGK